MIDHSFSMSRPHSASGPPSGWDGQGESQNRWSQGLETRGPCSLVPDDFLCSMKFPEFSEPQMGSPLASWNALGTFFCDNCLSYGFSSWKRNSSPWFKKVRSVLGSFRVLMEPRDSDPQVCSTRYQEQKCRGVNRNRVAVLSSCLGASLTFALTSLCTTPMPSLSADQLSMLLSCAWWKIASP